MDECRDEDSESTRKQTKSEVDRLLRGHRKLVANGSKLLSQRLGEERAAEILQESDQEFEQLIPQIPYIGGKENPLTDTLEQMTSLLALYRVLKKLGWPVEDIGDLTLAMANLHVQKFPGPVRSLIGRLYMSNLWRWRTRKKAAISQEQRYPGDFVYNMVEGDGKTFAWGINYVECGVVKFFSEQGAQEFTPYMCQIDGLIFPAIGIELQRTGTIGTGCSHCDFRFRRSG